MNRFVINVALAGQHYCRMTLPDTLEYDAVVKAQFFAATLGPRFEVALTRWNDVGTPIDIKEG